MKHNIECPHCRALTIATVPIKDHRKFVNTHYMTRDGVVPFYTSLILTGNDSDVTRVNSIILKKWTQSGLLYIKEKAWKAAAILNPEKVKAMTS
jgi:hypothetical protein